VLQGVTQVVQQLAAPECFEGTHGDQKRAARGMPALIGAKAPGADQAMHVRVMAERASPSMQIHQDARRGAEKARIAAQVDEAVARALEQQVVEAAAVVFPQRDELVGQGEHDVVVIAR